MVRHARVATNITTVCLLHRVVLAQDVALVLRMEKTLFLRLVYRIAGSFPIAKLCYTWPPPPPTAKSVQYPLSLVQITVPKSGDRDPIQQQQQQPNEPAATTVLSAPDCRLLTRLVSHYEGESWGVVLSQTLLNQLLEVVELQLFEETQYVHAGALRRLVRLLFEQPTDPAPQRDTTAPGEDAQNQHMAPVEETKEEELESAMLPRDALQVLLDRVERMIHSFWMGGNDNDAAATTSTMTLSGGIPV